MRDKLDQISASVEPVICRVVPRPICGLCSTIINMAKILLNQDNEIPTQLIKRVEVPVGTSDPVVAIAILLKSRWSVVCKMLVHINPRHRIVVR